MKYELDVHTCLTNCPYLEDYTSVASIYCIENCEYFISKDEKNQTVDCIMERKKLMKYREEKLKRILK